MKRRDIVDLYKNITNITSKNYNKFLLFSIIKTKNAAKEIITKIADMENTINQNTGIIEFDNKRKKILEEYCEKNEDGTCRIINGIYDIDTNREIIDIKISELKIQYLNDFKKYEDDLKEYEKFINEDIEFVISKTSFDNIPTDLTPEEFEFLLMFVEE